MAQWKPVPLSSKLLQNVKETGLTNESARIENAYLNDAKELVRFPYLQPWVTIPGSFPVFLHDWRGDLIAVSGGKTYRIDEDGNIEDMTGVNVTGQGRPIFAKTEDELLSAAGGRIVSFKGVNTQILSSDAPESTHVVYIDGYVLAIEPRTGRFYHSANGDYSSWDPLDTFAAEGKPDNLNAALVTEFNELLLCGEESIEQFDAVANGQTPFARRWMLGAGLFAPYTAVSVDNRVWGINQRQEFVSFTAQTATSESRDIQKSLEDIDDWTMAWGTEVSVNGQRFIILQMPYATNVYDTQGVTFLYDYQNDRFYNLFGWDFVKGEPTRWPGWSYRKLNQVKYIGGEGVIYKLMDYGLPSDEPTRFLWRSGHLDNLGLGKTRIDRVRMRVRRGDISTGEDAPIISLRVNKDNKGFGNWSRRSLGKSGQKEMFIEFPSLGTARTWQFETQVTDRCPVEIKKIEVLVEAMDR